MAAHRIDLSLAPDEAELRRYGRVLASSGHVRIEPAFAVASAEALYRHLASELEWWRAVNQGEQTWDLGPDSIAALEGEQGAAFMQAVESGARDGFQFLFDSVRVSEDPAERAKRGLLLDALIDSLNSPASLAALRKLLRDDRVALVDGQATRYLPGHFLTSHDDGVEGKNRLAAYVINLTPRWRTQWGGLLQFHDARGDVTRALAPSFNAINVFRVPQLHSVTYVAPFAGAPRYSITGWLRAA